MRRAHALLMGLALAGCAPIERVPEPEPSGASPAAEASAAAVARTPAVDAARDEATIRDLRHQVERLTAQLAEAQRRHAALNEDHRRGEVALRESQRKAEELQQKLDALLAIDRDTRRRSKTLAK